MKKKSTASQRNTQPRKKPRQRRAFITGSRKYGKPKKSSDIDLVVLMNPTDFEELLNICTKAEKEKIEWGSTHTDPGPHAASLQFGRLNLIAVTSNDAYDVWKKGTDELCLKDKDITREKAIKHFAKLRAKLAEKDD